MRDARRGSEKVTAADGVRWDFPPCSKSHYRQKQTRKKKISKMHKIAHVFKSHGGERWHLTPTTPLSSPKTGMKRWKPRMKRGFYPPLPLWHSHAKYMYWTVHVWRLAGKTTSDYYCAWQIRLSPNVIARLRKGASVSLPLFSSTPEASKMEEQMRRYGGLMILNTFPNPCGIKKKSS